MTEALRLTTCHGKERFNDFRKAQKVAKAMRRRKKTKTIVTPYRCHFCQGFHVGSRSFKERKRIEA